MSERSDAEASRDPPAAAPGHVPGPAWAARGALSPAVLPRVTALLCARPWHVGVGSLAAGLALATASPAALLVVAAVSLGLLCACRAPALAGLAAALVLAGSAFGDARLRAIDSPAALVVDGRTVEVAAHLLSPPRPSAFGASAEVRVAGGRLDGVRLLLRVPRWAELPAGVRVGDELRLRGRLRKPGDDAAETRNGSFDFAAHLRMRGISGELLLDRARATGRRRGGPAHVLDLMRERAARAVAAGLPPPEASLARGMVLGQDEAIGEGVREDFRASGLAHLLGRERAERHAAGRARAAAPGRRRARPAWPRGGPARARRDLRAARRGGPFAAAGRCDGRGRHRGDDAVAPGVALVRPAARRGGDSRAEPAGMAGPRLAALVRGGGGDPLPRRAARSRPGSRGGWPRRGSARTRSGRGPLRPDRCSTSAFRQSGPPSSAGWPTAPPSRSLPLLRRRPCSPATSARCRWPGCPPTCSRFRRLRRRCGSAWSRRRSASLRPRCRRRTGSPRRSGRSPACRSPT